MMQFEVNGRAPDLCLQSVDARFLNYFWSVRAHPTTAWSYDHVNCPAICRTLIRV